MKLKVENDRLIVYEEEWQLSTGNQKKLYKHILDIDIKELARLLKPYIDEIPNCECGKK